MKKKVLFLIYQLINGGAEKVMIDIVNHMDSSQYEVTVLTVIDCTKDAQLLKSHIKYEYIFKGKMKEDRVFFKLFYKISPKILHQIFIKKKYDIEIAALEGIPTKIISGCECSSTKKIAIIHSDAYSIAWPTKRYKDKQQEIASYENLDNIIFVSKNTQTQFLNKFKIEPNKTQVLYNPFDFDKINEKSLEPVDDFKRTSKYLFCAIGRLEKVKGFDRLIEAFKIVHRDHKNIQLIILGEGRERYSLSLLINQYKLNDIISILGYRENPYKYLKMSDCYICSSHSEGLSSTIIEAMILNMPIIATDCGGMDELLDGYDPGVIVNNNIYDLIEEINRFLISIEKGKHIRKESERSIKHKFSYENYFDEIAKVYQ
ncbi:glycosyltransferase [Heyndrickxia oleronia]|uniref:glycosyltransferase n=1 Tax=Heyndrickxia oleronia TaxID=38875 RepID=UPI00242F3C37|nr:glycosyltransferase [Heyndrickxia oleronia]MCI1590682.1 glycosyltransferase [Heyndrickxia oleronia]MCI1612129.1 glycosyltransferase [Heyndrickxia oleronia]MCI1759838.1 glycosyltransferase [Heyndrickxia oleronia]